MTEFLSQPRSFYWFQQCVKEKHSEENLIFYHDVSTESSPTEVADRFFAQARINRGGTEGRMWAHLEAPHWPCLTHSNQPAQVHQRTHYKRDQRWVGFLFWVTKITAGGPIDKTIFDPAFDHIVKLMFENEYLEFRRTNYFVEWLKEIEKKKPDDLRDKWYKKFGQINPEDLPQPPYAPLLMRSSEESLHPQ